MKTLLLDHLCQSYQILSARYGKGPHFILCADANKLDLEPILSLTPAMRQVVTTPTRLNPKEILDPIITTLGAWYQNPVCLAPVEADPGTGGKASDHLIPTMRPINMIDNLPARIYRKVTVRPLPESGLATLESSLSEQLWSRVLDAKTADEKANIFHEVAMELLNKTVPEKVRKVASDDQDWFTDGLKKLDRRCKREFHQNRKSKRYLSLSKTYQTKCKEAKKRFYKDIIQQAKQADPNSWYRLLKRISNHDTGKTDQLHIDEISSLSDREQVEEIAKAFNAPSQKYEPLQNSVIQLPHIEPKTIPQFTSSQIKGHIDIIKTNKATIPGDIPAKIMKRFSQFFCVPMADIINTSIRTGSGPDRYKKELITPVAKVSPTEKLDQLRPISNLPLCDKISEKVISQMVIEDMKAKMDPKQYGNQKHISIQHYLVEMLHRILSSVDNNSKGEITAVLCLFVDWKAAYSNQCHKLGI